jgi:hypothetical protein
MKKTITAIILAAAAVSPALASDGSESATHYRAQPGHVAVTDGMGAYAFAPRGNWQATQDANIRHQWQITDR